MSVDAGSGSLRRVELLGAISLATDLGTGQPAFHGVRSSVLAVALARALGLAETAAAEVQQVALLRFLGCTADTWETARMTGGDDLAFLAGMAPAAMGSKAEMGRQLIRTVGAGQRRPRRAALVAAALADPSGAKRSLSAHCEVAAMLVDRLADRFTCVTYDRRGHTRSPMGREPESVATHAADAASLIETLGLDRPVVIGSSGGARIGVELARTRPDLLAGAAFSEPPIFSLEPVAGQAFMAEVAAAVRPAAETGGPAAAVDAFFPLICPGLWSQIDETTKDRYRANGTMMLAEFTGPSYQLNPEDAATIELPCLVIAGTTSHPALRAIAARLVRALPDARFVELEGSGHVTYAERADGFARAVASFATELAGRKPNSASLAS
jgi:3-oxoadipate enol-lactonase